MVGEKEGMVIDVAGEEGRGPITKTLKYFQQGRNKWSDLGSRKSGCFV